MSKDYFTLKNKVLEINKLNDEISLIEWNKDDGPKFDTVEEMKDFGRKLENGDFDFLIFGIEEFDKENSNYKIIESYTYTLENICFNVYILKKHNRYITYLALKSNEDENVLHNLCRKECDDRKNAYLHFETLKTEIASNTIENIIQALIVGAEQTINSLKNKLVLLTSES